MLLATISLHKKIIWLTLICFLGSYGFAQADEISQEDRVKAAFLVNFARFITWPECAFSSDRQELIFCVAGDNPFSDALSIVESKQINGRKLRIIYVDSLSMVPRCNLLYVSRSEEDKLEHLSTDIGQQPVVTVSDIPGFTKAGGSIKFVKNEKRLSFIINNIAMKQLGIQASSSLLDLAAAVR